MTGTKNEEAVEHLIVSLNRDRMLEVANGARGVNIWDLIEHVPSATILSGDPSIAVQVEVEKQHERELRRSVSEICTVGYYRDFVPLRG